MRVQEESTVLRVQQESTVLRVQEESTVLRVQKKSTVLRVQEKSPVLRGQEKSMQVEKTGGKGGKYRKRGKEEIVPVVDPPGFQQESPQLAHPEQPVTR